MRKSIVRILKVAGIIGIAFTLGACFTAFKGDKKNFEVVQNLDIFHSLFKELSMSYVDDIDSKKLIKTAIDNMLKSLDPYTNYIPHEDMEDFKLQTTGEYGGVGSIISLSDTSLYVMVREVYPDMPAHKAGLKPGDRFIEVAGVDVRNKSVSDVSDLLRGKPDTDCKIKLLRDGKEISTVAHRQKIQLNAVPYSTVLDGNVGYILLTSFTTNCAEEVARNVKSLKEQGATSLILDLRANPGGLLDESLKLANLFIPRGSKILTTKGRVQINNRTYTATANPLDTIIPMVVMVNRASASAAEIVSGSLQDMDRAVIIGQRSYGKGLVQTTREIEYNNALKLTTAKYYIPSGRCIQALDYSHRDESGAVGYVPDSLISEFKTLHGRTVYDGGGISPDIYLEPEKYSNISVSLLAFNIPFFYAVDYVRTHPQVADYKTFSLSDAEFADFCKYVANYPKFEYKSRTFEAVKALEKAAKSDKYFDENTALFDQLRTSLKPQLEKDLEINKDEIKELVESEIMVNKYYRAGGLAHGLRYDKEVDEAIKVLKDKARYEGLLNGTVKSHAGDKRMSNSKTN
ncbi:MAG: S41 family peptidase [Bacteroidales bacterium]|nr:S41 family peptidase [Bacteroidales bacterium]